MTHIHHIIPRYRCKEIGIDPDFPENLIELTVWQHAAAHWDRYRRHGRSEDLGAVNLILERGVIDTSGENAYWYGKHHSDATKQKMSEDRQGEKNHTFGMKHSDATKRKMSKAAKGRKLSPEHIKHMSESTQGALHHFYGKKQTVKVKKKISNTLKGHKVSDHTRKKISDSLKLYYKILAEKKQ